MILCGKLEHQQSLEIVNLLTLFQTQPSWYAIMIKMYSQMSFFKENKQTNKKTVLGGKCIIAHFFIEEGSSLLQRHLTEIQEGQAQILVEEYFLLIAAGDAMVEHHHIFPVLVLHPTLS